MQCISKEDGNIVLLHQGEIGNKLRRLIKYMGLSAHHKQFENFKVCFHPSKTQIVPGISSI